MAYLDSSPPPDPSFLQTLARSLGIGGQTTPVDPVPNRAALASALSGQPPPAPPGAHYAHLPGPPLLLPGGEVQSTAEQTAPAPAVVPTIAPQTAPIHGSVADIAQPDIAKAAVTPPASVVVPGYEAKGPLTRAQVSAAPDDDKTMPAEEDWDAAAAKAAKPTSGVQVAQAGQAAPSQSAASIYDQALKSRYDQQEQLYNRFNAQAAAARTPEIAEIFARQAAAALAEGNRILDERQAMLKPGSRVLPPNELTDAERGSGAEYQVDANGNRTIVPGTEGDTTHAPNQEQRARAAAAGLNPDDIQVSDGKIELIKTADPEQLRLYNAVKADNIARGLPVPSVNDFLMEKSAAGRQTESILDASGQPIDESKVQGPAILQAVPPQVSRMAQAMIEGRSPIPNLSIRTDPVTRQGVLAAQAADPSLDVGNATARVKVRNEFLAGGPSSPAARMTAGNNAINHIDEAMYYAQQLHDLGFDTLNVAANLATPGSSAVGKALAGYKTAVKNFAGEVVKFNTGSEGSLSDREEMQHLFSENLTFGERSTAAQSQIGILTSNMVSLQKRWRDGMGPLVPDFETIHPDSLASIERIKGNAPYPDKGGGLPPSMRQPIQGASAATPVGAPANTAAPVRIQGEADYAKLPSGATFVGPDGQTRTKR